MSEKSVLKIKNKNILKISTMFNMKEMKAAIYIRVSTLQQSEKGYGKDAQLRNCEYYCKMKGYTLIETYVDTISGTTDYSKRRGLSKLLDDGKKGLFNIAIIYSFDRLSRSMLVLPHLVEKFKEYGVDIASCKEQVDTSTPHGLFQVNIIGSVAQLELETIKSRLMNGKNEKRLLDGQIGGVLPYGYQKVDKEIKIHPQNSKIIKYIYDTYHKHKYSMNRIAKLLNESNILSPGGKTWSFKAVSRILDRKNNYEGGIIYGNENNIRWPIILDKIYPERRQYRKEKK